MNIKLVHWPLNNLGGILTWIREIKFGLQALGHEVEVVCPADYHPKQETMAEDSYERGVPACRVTPIVSDAELKQTMGELNSADLVIFCHPSPHPTKAQLSKFDGRRWMQVYVQLRVPRLVVFHDNNWEKTNAWFKDVSLYVPSVLAAQHIFMESVEKYPTNHRDWSFFPIRCPEKKDFPRCGGLMATQWLRWKRHREFMDKVPALSEFCPFDLYNGGIEYWYLRKEEIWQNHIGEDTVVQYKGVVPHGQIIEAMQQAKLCVDFSKRGYTNYTHWEPLLCGAHSMVHEDVLLNRYCELPKNPMVVPFNDENFIETVRLVMERDPGPEREETIEWCRQRMDPLAVCNLLLERFELGHYTV